MGGVDVLVDQVVERRMTLTRVGMSDSVDIADRGSRGCA